MMDFKQFLFNDYFLNQYNAIAYTENVDYIKIKESLLPFAGLDLPSVKKTAKIEIILDKKNPIFIQLSDGTKLFFSLDEFRRIRGKPEIGKSLIVVMQRLPQDRSVVPSKIIDCEVIS